MYKGFLGCDEIIWISFSKDSREELSSALGSLREFSAELLWYNRQKERESSQQSWTKQIRWHFPVDISSLLLTGLKWWMLKKGPLKKMKRQREHKRILIWFDYSSLSNPNKFIYNYVNYCSILYFGNEMNALVLEKDQRSCFCYVVRMTLDTAEEKFVGQTDMENQRTTIFYCRIFIVVSTVI